MNELFLCKGREWSSTFDPLVFTVTDAIYDKRIESVPFVIGPSLVKKQVAEIPHGILLKNTRVAGPYPFRGGHLAMTVVLCRVRRDNYAAKLLQLVETAAATLDFATAVTSYIKVGRLVLDGVETLFNSEGTTPLVGLRREYDMDGGDAITPKFHALINIDQKQIPATGEFWVKDGGLCFGKTLAAAEPYRGADYVLYQLARADSRTDYTSLPFYSLYDQVKKEAALPEEVNWKQAKANMLSLWQAMVLSPDLIATQRDQLVQQFTTEMKRLHKEAGNIQTMGIAGGDKNTQDELNKAVAVLDL